MMLARALGPPSNAACSQLVADKQRAASITALLQAVGSKPRLVVLLELYGDELSVHELLRRTGLGASSLSQHLGMLRRQGLVRARRQGTGVSYALSSGPIRPLLTFLLRRFGLARSPSNQPPGVKQGEIT